MDKREVAKLVFVMASVSLVILEGTIDRREVAKLVLFEVSVSLLAAARDRLQFLPGFADKLGDWGVTCVHIQNRSTQQNINEYLSLRFPKQGGSWLEEWKRRHLAKLRGES